MVGFDSAIQTLERLGVSDVLLPFILVFTVIFAVLENLKFFNKKNGDKEESGKKFHVVIALVMALAVVIPHVTNSYPNSNYDVVNIINNSLPNVSIISVAVICVLVLLGVLGLHFEPGNKSILASIFWMLSFGIVIYVFGSSAGWGWKIPNWLSFLNDPDTQALLIIGLVFGLIIWFVTKPELSAADRDKKSKERFSNMGNFIKGIYNNKE